MNFELGGVRVPILACLEFSQTYEPIGGSVIHRMQSGKAVKQTHYTKWRTTLSGQGWIPVGLNALDYRLAQCLKCAAPQSVFSTYPCLTLPTARRQDEPFVPKGFAMVGQELMEVAMEMQADIATLSAIPDARGYCVHYYPEWQVFAEMTQMQANLHNAEFSWSITAEQI